MKKYFPFFVGVGIFLADFFSKKAAQNLKNPIAIFGDFFKIEFHQNSGIAFSMPVPMILQILLSAIFLIAIGFWFLKKTKNFWEKMFLSAIFFGALGNFAERIFFGKVTDFLAVGNFPVFNFADVAIFSGVLGIFFAEFFQKNSPK